MDRIALTVTAPASPTRSHLNPHAPWGAQEFRPRDVAYVVEAPNSSAHNRVNKLWIVTCDAWLRGWEVNRQVRLLSSTHVIRVTVKGIMDFATLTAEGSVPNLRLPHWRAENPDAKKPTHRRP